MRNSLILAVTLASLAAPPAFAKSWSWQALDITNDVVKVVDHGTSCNYQKSIGQARKAAATLAKPAFTLVATDDPVACPPQTRKPKASASPADSSPAN